MTAPLGSELRGRALELADALEDCQRQAVAALATYEAAAGSVVGVEPLAAYQRGARDAYGHAASLLRGILSDPATELAERQALDVRPYDPTSPPAHSLLRDAEDKRPAIVRCVDKARVLVEFACASIQGADVELDRAVANRAAGAALGLATGARSLWRDLDAIAQGTERVRS